MIDECMDGTRKLPRRCALLGVRHRRPTEKWRPQYRGKADGIQWDGVGTMMFSSPGLHGSTQAKESAV
jgi:hypothetical protein